MSHGQVLLLDIEGTVGRISFVKEVLYPYARLRLRGFLAGREAEWRGEVERAMAEAGEQAVEQAGGQAGEQAGWLQALERWSDLDRKVGVLKRIQGRIWAEGFRDGTLRAHLYPEVEGWMRRQVAAGARLAIYSSGSVEAQQLYFGHTVCGDLRPLISGWFDTTVGPKQAAGSYATIAARLGVAPGAIRFLSDQPAELAAARLAGCSVVQVRRPDEPGAPAGEGWPVVERLEG